MKELVDGQITGDVGKVREVVDPNDNTRLIGKSLEEWIRKSLVRSYQVLNLLDWKIASSVGDEVVSVLKRHKASFVSKFVKMSSIGAMFRGLVETLRHSRVKLRYIGWLDKIKSSGCQIC